MIHSWLRGKRGFLVFYVTVCLLVVGGLAWITGQILHLEAERARVEEQLQEERAEARRQREHERRTAAEQLERERLQTERSTNLRLALWRLDTVFSTELASEANRPYTQFNAGLAFDVHPTNSGKAEGKPIKVVELVPMADTDPPPPTWMNQHFLLASDSDWQVTPPQLRDQLIRTLNLVARPTAPQVEPEQLKQLNTLAQGFTFNEVQEQLARQKKEVVPYQNYSPLLQVNPRGGEADEAHRLQQNATQTVDKDTARRISRGINEQKSVSGTNNYVDNPKNRQPNPVLVLSGPPQSLWIGQGETERLAVSRSVQIGTNRVTQVSVLEQDALEAILLDEVYDLFPEAKMVRVRQTPEHPERTMTFLPYELDPGPLPEVKLPNTLEVEFASLAVQSGPEWNPLHLGLALSWLSAIAVLAAIGLGGWSVLDLSERRIAFVSAVTHELRTPLTTLRLYLDMLTSGMVTDETRRAEYLTTLSQESDRLNRLIGNVLDFSRLENTRPQPELRTESLSEVLRQVGSTWSGRCRDAGKVLIVAPPVAEIMLTTDTRILQQILGNLIDNACKYSRDASDPRIGIQVQSTGREVLFEVCDHGPGVPRPERGVIFKPFQRGRSANVTVGGVGLGLALAQRWARLLGGDLSLVATHVGATFRLSLPADKHGLPT